MKRSLFIFILPLLLAGAGCSTPKLDVDQAVGDLKNQVQEGVQGAVQEATERGAEFIAEQKIGKPVDVDFTGSGATFVDPSTGKTVSVGARVTIPSNFPSDVPRYPGATPTSLSFDPNRADLSLLLITTDSRTAIRDWYKAEGAAAGWTQEQFFETADQLILSFKKDGATLTVTLLPPNLQKETGILIVRNQK